MRLGGRNGAILPLGIRSRWQREWGAERRGRRSPFKLNYNFQLTI
jgi:hypothetical protein